MVVKWSGAVPCKYARNDIADSIPLSKWMCERKNCKRKPVKKVRAPNMPGKIALCEIHLREHEAQSQKRGSYHPLAAAVKESWS